VHGSASSLELLTLLPLLLPLFHNSSSPTIAQNSVSKLFFYNSCSIQLPQSLLASLTLLIACFSWRFHGNGWLWMAMSWGTEAQISMT
jgi:hypothetical protein